MSTSGVRITMTSQQLLLALLTVLVMAAGQILFKLAAGDLAQAGGFNLQLLLSVKLWLALLVYTGATVLWLLLLRQVPLSVAYPVVALAFVVVPLLSHWLLAEPLRWQSLAGAALIIAGVWVSVRTA